MVSDFHNDVLTARSCSRLLSEYASSENKICCAYFKGSRTFADAYSACKRFVAEKSDDLFLAFEDLSYTEDLSALGALLDLSPVYVTLTWNETNIFGGGARSTAGLTELGKKLIAELNARGIALDLAHANERTFFEAIELADRPVCSHACFSAVEPHFRNLSEREVASLAEKGGLIGLTFYRPFVSHKRNVFAEDVLRHIDWFSERFPNKFLAIGTDFNGCDEFPEGFSDYSYETVLRETLYKSGYDESVADGILYKNLSSFLASVRA